MSLVSFDELLLSRPEVERGDKILKTAKITQTTHNNKDMACSTSIVLLALLSALSLSVHKAHGRQCVNLPPGVDKIHLGVDISTFDLLPTGSNSQSKQNLKKPVFSFTCDNNYQWFSPSGARYDFPDQLWQMTAEPWGTMTAESKIYKSSQALKKRMFTQLGLSAAFKGLAFSVSGSFQKIEKSFISGQEYFQDIYNTHATFRTDVLPSYALKLSKFVERKMKRAFTKKYDDNFKDHDEFFDDYGTHYFGSANYGGIFRILRTQKIDSSSTKTDTELNAEATASYALFATANFKKNQSTSDAQSADKLFDKKDMRYYGGTHNLLGDFNFGQWLNSIKKKPYLINCKLQPIAELIRDKKIKANFEHSVNRYLLKQQLKQLAKVSSLINDKTLTNKLGQLNRKINRERLRKNGAVSEKTAKELRKELAHQLTVPKWFSRDTKLCMKWQAESNTSKVCGGRPKGEVCQRPGSATIGYLDNTFTYSGGCYMRWGITSKNQPDWFKKVKICYRFENNGNSGCTGQQKKDVCSSVNEFTDKYGDMSDMRGGGCIIRWKLVVPPELPVWLHQTKFCLIYSAKGTKYSYGCNGQTKKNTPYSICAQANSYTSEYRDKTQYKDGGCELSWGLFPTLPSFSFS